MKDFMKNRRKDQEAEGKLGEMSMEEETKLRKKVIKGNWNIAKDKASQQVRPHRTSVLNLTSCHCERRFR